MTQPVNPHFSDLDRFFPITQIFLEIEARLEELGVGVSLATLRNHVLRNGADEPSQAVDSRCRESLATTLRIQGKLGRMNLRHVHASLDVLELAVRACECARAPRPKNLRALLDEALAFVQQFDTLRMRVEQQKSEALAARICGGKARQAKLECARLRAARLLDARAPKDGWESPAHAARCIESDVAAFIARRHLCMWGSRRTIVRWIKQHPIVRAAFNRRQRPPRI